MRHWWVKEILRAPQLLDLLQTSDSYSLLLNVSGNWKTMPEDENGIHFSTLECQSSEVSNCPRFLKILWRYFVISQTKCDYIRVCQSITKHQFPNFHWESSNLKLEVMKAFTSILALWALLATGSQAANCPNVCTESYLNKACKTREEVPSHASLFTGSGPCFPYNGKPVSKLSNATSGNKQEFCCSTVSTKMVAFPIATRTRLPVGTPTLLPQRALLSAALLPTRESPR